MSKSGQDMRRRLQLAALELFQEAGYETTTAAQIAARAGVTERTFFRHFPDKREVLFDGEASLIEALTGAILNAPPALGPWDMLLRAFQSVEQLFLDNRSFSEPRSRIIAQSPALQERAQAKAMSVVQALASALCKRGVPQPLADLAAQMGMAALAHAFASWLSGPGTLDEHLQRAFHEVKTLASSSSAPARQPE